MQEKLNEFSPTALTTAIEESLREFWGIWGNAPQSDLYDGPEMLRLYTGVPFAFCNGVVCSRFSLDELDKAIDETISYFTTHKATWEWVVGPNPNPISLDKYLEKHGLCASGEMIGMAANLHEINEDIPSIENFQVVQVDDDQTLKQWANTVVVGFQAPRLYPTFVDLECSLGYHQPLYRRYLGLLNHQPVSTSALFLGAKVAGIYCVSTLSTVRKLGIGALITLHALLEARSMGYHAAVLQASQMGCSVYRRLGFQELSTLREYSPVN